MPERSHDSLLVSYYETFLRDQDANAFSGLVMARYNEGTLGRLVRSGDTQARRAAVLALGLIGSYQANATVAHALKDADPTVRDLAQGALWVIWFRADSPENNAMLERVAALLKRQRPDEAEALATALIARAPTFAEAYNQRAIAVFLQGRFADSATDCRRVLERNPYHIGALAGLGRCYLQLGRRAEALQTFRRALKLQPHSAALRETVTALEAEAD
jgi:tetratricopeptide (TPR) repeat protein